MPPGSILSCLSVSLALALSEYDNDDDDDDDDGVVVVLVVMMVRWRWWWGEFKNNSFYSNLTVHDHTNNVDLKLRWVEQK